MDFKIDSLLHVLKFLVYICPSGLSALTSCGTDSQCELAEIGSNHTISCSISGFNEFIGWFRKGSQNYNGKLPIFYKNRGFATCSNSVSGYNAQMQYINGTCKITLMFYISQQFSAGIYECYTDTGRPEGLQCNESLKINETNIISIVCSLTNIYPAAKMLLSYSGINKTTGCENVTGLSSGSIICQSDIPDAGMKAGLHTFDILIYPNVTNGTKYGVMKQLNISLSDDYENILTTTQGYIKQGTSANCTCHVKTQGVPPGGVKWFYNNGTEVESITSNGSAILQVRFSGKENNRTYSCKGASVIGENSTGIEFTVKNAFPAEIYQFTANSNVTSLTVSEDSNVVFLCKTESNPASNVEILQTTQIAANTTDVNFTKKMACEDSGEYICKAHNSEFMQSVQRSLVIYVQCVLQLRQEFDNYKTYFATLGKDVSLQIQVVGYPAPVNYSLLKHDKISINTSTSDCDNTKYMREYMPNSLPYGTVSVTIFNTNARDFGNYTLSVYNGLSDVLHIPFALVQDASIAVLSSNAHIAVAIGVTIGVIVILAVIVLVIIKCNAIKTIVDRKNTSSYQDINNDYDLSNMTSRYVTLDVSVLQGSESSETPSIYDKLETSVDYIGTRADYLQINAPTEYDPIDYSQFEPEVQYEHVTVNQETTYQHV